MPQGPIATAPFGQNPSGVSTPLQVDASKNLLVSLAADPAGPVNFVYKTVAASQTAAVLGTTGAAGDYLQSVDVFPAIAACGLVSILDGATTIATFPGGGTTALSDCKPFTIPINAVCTTAWKITTGASVAVVASGRFT